MKRHPIDFLYHLLPKLLFTVLFSCVPCISVASVIEAADTDTVSRELLELVVEAKREIHTDESDIIYLSSKNQRFGTNALDAISSLRQFSPVIDGKALMTANQKQVAIMINGRPATAQDLRGYAGKEIKQVTYYPVAPPRYSDVTDGPLVDVTVKVNRDYINIFLSASNSVNAGYGTDQAVVRWADSLNMIRADYFVDYKNLGYNTMDIYDYISTPGLSRSYMATGKYRGNYQYGKVSWQNTAKKNLLYVSAKFTHNPGKRTYDNRIHLEESGEEGYDLLEADYSRTLDNVSDAGNLSVFYRAKAGRGRFDIQADGSIGKSGSTNRLGGNNLEPYGTARINHTYMGYGKVMYYLPVRKVNFFFTGSYRYQHTDHDQRQPQVYSYDSDRENLILSGAVTGKINLDGKRVSYSVGAVMNYQDLRWSGGYGTDLRHCRFTPYVTLSSVLSNRVFLRMRGYIKSGMPGTGELSSVPTYQESHLAWVGSPDLKGWTMYGVSLQPEYAPIPGKLSFNGDFSYRYTIDPVKPCVFSGDPVEVRYINLSGLRDFDGSVYLNISPGGPVTVKPYFEWMYNGYTTPGRTVSKGYFRYGGSVSLNTKIIQSVVNVNAPYKSYSGDVLNYGGWQFSCSVAAKLPANISAFVTWHHSYQHDRTEICSPGIMNYVSRTSYPRLANQITLGLSWSFSQGIFKKRQQAQVEDAESDTGISDFNKAKM